MTAVVSRGVWRRACCALHTPSVPLHTRLSISAHRPPLGGLSSIAVSVVGSVGSVVGSVVGPSRRSFAICRAVIARLDSLQSAAGVCSRSSTGGAGRQRGSSAGSSAALSPVLVVGSAALSAKQLGSSAALSAARQLCRLSVARLGRTLSGVGECCRCRVICSWSGVDTRPGARSSDVGRPRR